MTYFTGLQCSMCGAPFPAEALYVCDKCLGPLEATYDADAIRANVSRELIESRPPSLWEVSGVSADRGGAVDRLSFGVHAARSGDASGD